MLSCWMRWGAFFLHLLTHNEARTTKIIPSLPALVEFAANVVNGQWTMFGVRLTSFPQTLSSHMLRMPFSQLFHPDIPYGAINVKKLSHSGTERAKVLNDNEGKSLSVTMIDFYCHVKIHANAPGQSNILRCHPKWEKWLKSLDLWPGMVWLDWSELREGWWFKFTYCSWKVISLGKCSNCLTMLVEIENKLISKNDL